MTDREEEFESDLLKIADYSHQKEQEFKGDEINKWAKVALRALGEFLQPKEAIMVESGGRRWFVWRLGRLSFRFLNPEAEAYATLGLKGIKTGTLVKVTRVTSDEKTLPTAWDEIAD